MAAVQNMFADVLLSMLHLLVWRLAVHHPVVIAVVVIWHIVKNLCWLLRKYICAYPLSSSLLSF